MAIVSFTGCNVQKKVAGTSVIADPSSKSVKTYKITANDVTAPDFYSYIQSIITLSYTDPDGHLATSCSVSMLSRVAITRPCSCDSLGICTVGVTNINGIIGKGSFQFSVLSEEITSTIATASFTVLAGHAPVTTPITPAHFNEDTESLIVLPYTDGELDPATSCSVSTLQHVTETKACSCAAGVCSVGVTGTSNYNGSGSFQFRVLSLGQSSNDSTATLTLNPVNDLPTITAIAAQSTPGNTTLSGISFTIADIDSPISCSLVVGSSSNTALITNANIVINGETPNCQATIIPTTNKSGVANITLTLSDTEVSSAVVSFELTVTHIPPSISIISDQSTVEDFATPSIAFTIYNADSSIACSHIVGTSSNTTLVPNANIVIAGSAPHCTAVITPAANQNGAVNITLTLADLVLPMPASMVTSVFALTVNAVNDSPLISPILGQSTDEDFASSAIVFTISDVDSNIACSHVIGTSSNTTIVPNANIVIAGSAPHCTAVITPAANQNGAVNITLTLTDLGTPMPALSAVAKFTLSIISVPDLSGQLAMAGVASSYSGNTYSRTMNFSTIAIDESISYVDVCLSRDSNTNKLLDLSELCNVQPWLDVTTALTASGSSVPNTWPNFKIKDGANGAIFSALETPLMNSCSTTNTYFLSIKVINQTNRTSNIISTPGWTFWEPTCLTSTILAQWLDASETATMTMASSKVSVWSDKSGNRRNVTQLTASKQPVYSSNALGSSLAGVTFNGTSTVLSTSGFAYNFGRSSYFSVMKGLASSNGSKYIFSEGSVASASNYYSPLATSTATTPNTLTGKIFSTGSPGLNKPLLSPVAFDGTLRFIMTEDSGASFFAYSNGTAQTQLASNYSRVTKLSHDYYCLGARWSNATAASWFSGTIGEFIITNGVLSTANRNKLEGYSAHKWGAHGNLPAGHTYLSAPP